MSYLKQRRRGVAGFTLVELLTVIAIIGILATLLLSVLATAKKKGRIAVCTSNLRQIVLAYEIYRQDFPERPKDLTDLVTSRRLSDAKVLICPEDRTGNWGQLVRAFRPGASNEVGFSYLTPIPWSDRDFSRLERKGGSGGLLACQLHGVRRQRSSRPNVQDFEGLFLRAQLDAAVVRRQMYWDEPLELAQVSSPSFAITRQGGGRLPWRFFVDLPPGQNEPEE